MPQPSAPIVAVLTLSGPLVDGKRVYVMAQHVTHFRATDTDATVIGLTTSNSMVVRENTAVVWQRLTGERYE